MAKISQAENINGNYKDKDIISIDQFDPESIKKLFSVAHKMATIAKNSKPSNLLHGNIATLLFYEPSSRTFASFAAAIKQLGGQTVEILNPQRFSSVSKGEAFEDTIRVFEAYCDVIILRHPQTGSVPKAAEIASVSVVNAGDGGLGEHPTQALLDIYTIFTKFHKLDHLTGVAVGDILYGRTVKSLIRALAIYPGNTLYLLSPKELRLPKEDFENLSKRGIKLIEIENEKDIPKNAHFWYWTRTQKERFKSLADYKKVKNKFILTKKLLDDLGGRNTILMHPLPRVGEIDTEVDNDPRAQYLRSQIRSGMYVRMALLALVLGKIR